MHRSWLLAAACAGLLLGLPGRGGDALADEAETSARDRNEAWVRSAVLSAAALRDAGGGIGAALAFRLAALEAEARGCLGAATDAWWEGGHASFARQDLESAREALARSAALAERVGSTARRARALNDLGTVLHQLSRPEEALRALTEARRLLKALGDERNLAGTLRNLSACLLDLGHLGEAGVLLHESLALARKTGDRAGVAGTTMALGNLELLLGRTSTARTLFEEGLAAAQSAGVPHYAANAHTNLGVLLRHTGDHAGAVRHLEAARAAFLRLGDRGGVADVLTNLAAVHSETGDLERSLAESREALALERAIGDRQGVVANLTNLGTASQDLGRPAEALRHYEEALLLAREIQIPRRTAEVATSLSGLLASLGDLRRARGLAEEAVKIWQGLGDPWGMALSLDNLGTILDRLGESSRALERHREALSLLEGVGDGSRQAEVLANLAGTLVSLGQDAQAAEAYGKALGLAGPDAAPRTLAMLRMDLAITLSRLGRGEEADAEARRALRDARRSRLPEVEAWARRVLARLHLMGGRPEEALLEARRALDLLPAHLKGLGDELGPAARALHSGAFVSGAWAAVQLGRPADLFEFLERGRAGSLLEVLGGREALRRVRLPETLRLAADEACRREAAAGAALARARKEGDRERTRAASAALASARDALGAVYEKMRREASHEADLVAPRVVLLEEARSWLARDEALVLYAAADTELLALVVEAAGARIVRAGPLPAVVEACEALAASAATGREVEGPAAALRRLAVEPLALREEVRRLVVSPDGPLAFVPPALVFAERDVTFVPSATVLGLLGLERESRGGGVLAIGDPVYEGAQGGEAQDVVWHGGPLLRIEATGREAAAVGDVVLTRQAATESALRSALSAHEGRWRSVHLACHGLLDLDRPALSALALTPEPGDDGLLTASDVLDLDVRSDLVVLSACETARGTYVRAEGVFGLVRAFLHAGAPRLLASLWKVDDEATRALMERFYAGWDPEQGGEPEGAAAALRAAQAHVRAVPRWAHPRYWAAWVLWGRP